jgi:microsomal dipeptidase-like Zn-dependent dipeptidase
MLRHTTSQEEYERVRQPIKRRAVSLLRSMVDAVPKLGDIGVFLGSDIRAQDAVYTLNAMSFSPNLIAKFIDREGFTEGTVTTILGKAASRNLIKLLEQIK